MKKTNIKGVPPLDWLWYEQLFYLFTNTTKINGVCQGVDKKIHITRREIDVVDVSYEDENVPKTWMTPTFGVMEIFAFRSGVVPLSFNSNTQRACNCLISKVTLIESWKIRRWKWMLDPMLLLMLSKNCLLV